MLSSTELILGDSRNADFREELTVIKCYKAKVVSNKNLRAIKVSR